MDEYKLKPGKIGEKVIGAYKKVEDTVVGSYKKVEDAVVGGYKKMEDTVVGGYKKVEDAFVDAFLEKAPPKEELPADGDSQGDRPNDCPALDAEDDRPCCGNDEVKTQDLEL